MTAAAATPTLPPVDETTYRRRIRAWALYDWANSAFATTILAAVLPVYYSQVAGSTLPSAAVATQYWSITLGISVLVVAILSPILGTVSDIMRGKKKFLSLFVGIGVVGTGLLVLVDTGDWLLASIFFLIGRIGFAAANVFYDALLPHVARPEDQDRVSTLGYALGYLGGGLLLAVNVVMIFTMDGNWGVRWSLFSVAVWWLLFSIPIFRVVPEPESVSARLKPGESLVRVSFAQIGHTLRHIRQYRELFKFLVGFLIYNDGIGIVITVAAIYGAELGFSSTELILAILLVQFVGIPYSLVFGNLPAKADRRQPLFVAFVVFNIVALPLVGILGQFLLPQTLTGRPSPDFAAGVSAVGQGAHEVSGPGFELRGAWTSETVSGALRGLGCPWYRPGCDAAAYDAVYAVTSTAGDAFALEFNGQPLALTYAAGPDRGIWEVLLDGAPLLDADGAPLRIDGYSETVRYDVKTTFQAPSEGAHVLTLVNSGARNPAADGTVMAVYQVEVLPPLRSSSLPAIIGVLLLTQLAAALFAFTIGRALCRPLAE